MSSSGKNSKQCPKKKPQVQCCPTGEKKRQARRTTPCCKTQMSRAPVCPNNIDATNSGACCGSNNNDEPCASSSGTGGQPSTTPNQQVSQKGLNSATVEEEVDRLVEAARQFSEKEKMKLKEFYEEEILRRKTAVIQEFKCAMEKEVIAPLKAKLCAYEKEIQILKQKYEKALKTAKGSDISISKSNNLSQVEIDVLENELKKAHERKDELAEVIVKENKRRSQRSVFTTNDNDSTEAEWGDDEYDDDEGSYWDGSFVGPDEGQVPEKSQAGESKPVREPRQSRKTLWKAKDGQAMGNIGEEHHPENWKNPKDKPEQDDKLSQGFAVVKEEVKTKEEIETDSELPDDTKRLKEKIKELTAALNAATKFAEDEIAELIKEQALREELERALAELLMENTSLRARVDQWLEQIDVLDNGVIGNENSKLRRRIQELEGDRTRASVEAELKKLRDELSGVVTEARRENSTKDVDNNRPCDDCSVFTAPYIEKIRDLEDRIQELMDQLVTFSELERRIQELQAESEAMAELRKKYDAMNKELDELKNVQCPIDEDGLSELRRKLEQTENKLKETKDELNDLKMRTRDLETANARLTQSVADFEIEHEKTVQLEAMHAQMLEEKRRKSEDARQLAEKVRLLEEAAKAQGEELDKTKQQLEDTQGSLRRKEEENERLEREVKNLREEIVASNEREKKLTEELRAKEKALSDMEGKYEAAREENQRLKRELDELRERYEAAREKREQLEKELKEANEKIERNQKEFQQKLRAEQKRAEEMCGELSAKGQCILDHEKKTLAVTTQLAEDNQSMQERIRQLEDQLEQMMSMENRTRGMFKEIGELQKRAQARTRELEELKKLPETCKLNTKSFAPSTTSSQHSLPSLPLPSDERFWGDKDIQKDKDTQKDKDKRPKEKAPECKSLNQKMDSLESERKNLNDELKNRLKALEDVQKQLDDVNKQGEKIKNELDKACKDDDDD